MNTIPIRPLLGLKLLTLTGLALLLLLLNGCRWVGVKGNGDVVTESRSVPDFSHVEADGAFTITWTPGPATFSIRTDKNLLEYIRTNVSGKTLRLEWIKPLRGTDGIKINISSAALTRAELNGAVRLVASNLSGPELFLQANGATRVALQGNVNALSGEMNGASRLDAESLKTHAMELSINGAGRADVTVSDALKVDISGAGKVTYAGNPTVDKDISGAGSVKRRDD